MLDAGLRVGEVTKLLVSDLRVNDQAVSAIQVRAAIAKRGRERIVPCSDRLKKAIANHITAFLLWRAEVTDEPAFTTGSSWRPLTTRQVQRIIEHASLEAIGRRIHPHILRHTFGSRLMRLTNSRIVQELLGHKNLSSTQVYTHPNGDDLTQAINSLENE